MQKAVFSLATIMLLAVSFLPAQTSKTYCNNRFGFCLNYPDKLSPSEEAPINSDGIILQAPDGVQVSVSGSYNVMDWTPEKIFEFTKADFAGVIGADASILENESTGKGFEALLSSGTYYQYAQMVTKGDVYLILTVTGPAELLEDTKTLRQQLKLTFDNATEGQ